MPAAIVRRACEEFILLSPLVRIPGGNCKPPWYDRAMNTLKWLVIFTFLGYGAIVALLYFGQRAMQYFPERFRTAPAAAGLPEAEEVVLDTADGERVIAWHVRPRSEPPLPWK